MIMELKAVMSKKTPLNFISVQGLEFLGIPCGSGLGTEGGLNVKTIYALLK